MLEEEKNKVLFLRKDLTALQDSANSFSVLNTVLDLPGVSPENLIEIMSCKIIQMKNECNTAKNIANQLQCESNKLKRTLNVLTKQIDEEKNSKRKVIENSNSTSAFADHGESLNEGIKDGYIGRDRGRGKDKDRERGRDRGRMYGREKDTSLSREISNVRGTIVGVSSNVVDVIESDRNKRSSNKHDKTYNMNNNTHNDRNNSDIKNYNDNDNDNDNDDYYHIKNNNDNNDNINNDDINLSALSLVVDGETSPQILLESLNAMAMASAMRSQSKQIIILKTQLNELNNEIICIEKNKINDVDDNIIKINNELDFTSRRLNLVEATLIDVRNELLFSKERERELELKLIEKETKVFQDLEINETKMTKNIPSNFSFAISKMISDAHTTTINQLSDNLTEDDRLGMERTKSLLKERTAQLKILMETLESLQESNIAPKVKNLGPVSSGEFLGEDTSLFGLAGFTTGPSSGMGVDSGPGSGIGSSSGAYSVEGPWVVQSLVKRVIDLTAELTSQNSNTVISDKRIEEFEKELLRKSNEINQLKNILKKDEETTVVLRLHLNSLGDQIKEVEKKRGEDIYQLNIENERLLNNLKESENNFSDQLITIDELHEKIQFIEENNCKEWLESLIINDNQMSSAYINNCHDNNNNNNINDNNSNKNNNDNDNEYDSISILLGANSQNRNQNQNQNDRTSVRNLVLSLLHQWKEQVGPINFIKQGSGGGGVVGTGINKEIKSLSKAEQKFFQEICDLTLAAEARSNLAVNDALIAEKSKLIAEMNLKICENRLRGTVSQLQKFRNRSIACQQLRKSDKILKGKKNNKLISLLKLNLLEHRNKIQKLTNDINIERSGKQLAETERTSETLQLRRLQLKIAELESRGSFVLRGRDDAINGFENRIKHSEDSLCDWFKTELPRLMSGMPLPEDSMATFFDNPSASAYVPKNSLRNVLQSTGGGYAEGKDSRTYSGSNMYGGSGTQTQIQNNFPVTDRLLGALSLDRTYAMAQSLCTCKAAQTAQEMRISALTEKNSILRECSLEMQGVLTRWGAEIEETSIILKKCRNDSNKSNADIDTDKLNDNINNKQLNNNISNSDAFSYSKMIKKYEKSEFKIMKLQKSLADVEYQNIELQNNVDCSTNQLKEMSNIIDIMNNEENLVKNETTKNTMKWKNKMENAHFQELKTLRIESAEEKRVLKV